mmetsp:Transcript_25954/g.60007  ORF Transcript_25954/g.60007 Transcript_25954/m.60007 type:complete len:267 (+) Transcript_25954:1067-1867(+)
MGEGNWRVEHHARGGRVILIIVHVEEYNLLPMLVPLTCIDELWNVELGSVHLDEVHQPLRLVLGIETAKLCVEANMRPFGLQAILQQCDELFKVTSGLIRVHELLQVIWVNNDLHASSFCTTELLCADAGQVHFLPCPWVVRLLRCINCLCILSKLHVALGQLGVVGDGGVENLRCLVQRLIVQAVSDAQGIGSVATANELLHVTEALCLCIGVNQFAVNELILCLASRHQQVLGEIIKLLSCFCCCNDLGVVIWVLGLEVRINCL